MYFLCPDDCCYFNYSFNIFSHRFLPNIDVVTFVYVKNSGGCKVLDIACQFVPFLQISLKAFDLSEPLFKQTFNSPRDSSV